MKKESLRTRTSLIMLSLMMVFPVINGQDNGSVIKKYLTSLPSVKTGSMQTKYRMTTIQINRDLYGNFMNKTKITGDYTRGFEDGHMVWNNVFISHSSGYPDPFTPGEKQEYIENFIYYPTDNMLSSEAFRNFPKSPDNILARNLIWDMMTFETYAWMFWDSLQLNKPLEVVQADGEFDMAEIGTYNHNKIILIWQGISQINGELCAVIDFAAIDNLIELKLDQMNSKGTEQYWGTVWVSLQTKTIEKALMYGGVMMEIQVSGMANKLLIKTVRELRVEKLGKNS